MKVYTLQPDFPLAANLQINLFTKITKKIS